MTAGTESPQELGTKSPSTVAPAFAGNKFRVADVWPPMMIVLGIALTIAWTAGLIEVMARLM